MGIYRGNPEDDYVEDLIAMKHRLSKRDPDMRDEQQPWYLSERSDGLGLIRRNHPKEAIVDLDVG